MFWADTQNAILWQRSLDNTAWINKGPIDSQLAELDDLKKYSANSNLFINSLFDDWNGATLPYAFWNYYGGGSRNPQIEKVSIYDNDPHVNQLATLLNDDYQHRVTQSAHALKVTLDAGNGEWSLNQEALVPRDTWISQGIYLYIVTEGDADIRIHDDPWPQEISPIPEEKFNQPFKWFQFKQTGKSGGDLGFMISIKDSSAPVTVYMMAPWLCYGYCDHWVDSGLNSQTLKKLNRATPFVCANANPFFSADNGDQFLHTYNPHNHTIDQVFVEPDHNEITKQLSYYLGGFDDDDNRHGMTLLSYAKPRFMKVTVTRNSEHNNISFTLTGTGDQYSFASGTTTAFIGLFGVEKGNVTWRDGTRVDEKNNEVTLRISGAALTQRLLATNIKEIKARRTLRAMEC